jgi:hypothetical protein
MRYIVCFSIPHTQQACVHNFLLGTASSVHNTATEIWGCLQTCLVIIEKIVDRGFSTGVPRNPKVPRDVARGSARDRD